MALPLINIGLHVDKTAQHNPVARTLGGGYLCYIERGKGSVVGSTNVELRVGPGMMFYVPAGDEHRLVPDPTWDDYWLVLREHETLTSFGDLLPPPWTILPMSPAAYTLALWRELRDLWDADQLPPEVEARHLLHQLLYQLYRQLHQEVTVPGMAATGGRMLASRMRMRHWVDQGWPLDLPSLADTEGMSYEVFRRRFREVVGCSPKRFFIGLKMDRAMQLLAHSQWTIREIGRFLGYDDPAFFSRLFKQKAGISPQQFRDGHRPGERGERPG